MIILQRGIPSRVKCHGGLVTVIGEMGILMLEHGRQIAKPGINNVYLKYEMGDVR